MSNVVSLDKYRKKEVAPQITSAHNAVEYMRKEMYSLPSNQARMEFMQCLIAQLCNWIIKSNHYDNPVNVIRSWVDKKCDDYSKKRSGG